MRSGSFRIGSVLGIEVRLHITFVLLLAAAAIDAVIEDGFGAAATLGAEFGILFLCVLLHELGHSVTAKHYGIRVKDILLWPLGGVARLERLPDSTGAELWIALAGPAVNLLIIVVLAPFAYFQGVLPPDLGHLESEISLLEWALIVNGAMGIFNLTPAFPMDGGRVLRAILARHLGSVTATSSAVLVGRLLALGAFVAALTDPRFISLGILGVFVWIAGGAELDATLRRDALRRLTDGSTTVYAGGAIDPGPTFAAGSAGDARLDGKGDIGDTGWENARP